MTVGDSVGVDQEVELAEITSTVRGGALVKVVALNFQKLIILQFLTNYDILANLSKCINVPSSYKPRPDLRPMRSSLLWCE